LFGFLVKSHNHIAAKLLERDPKFADRIFELPGFPPKSADLVAASGFQPGKLQVKEDVLQRPAA
jgi:hypothetical protein